LSLELKSPMAGRHGVWLSARDQGGLESGWSRLGAWEASRAPELALLYPESGKGPAREFNFFLRDIDGAANLRRAQVRFGQEESSRCRLDFDLANRKFALAGEDGGWRPAVGYFTSTEKNSHCRILSASSYASSSSDNQTILNVRAVFEQPLQGELPVFVQAWDAEGNRLEWTRAGVWEATWPNRRPAAAFDGETGQAEGYRVFKFRFHDADGLGDLLSAGIRFGLSGSGMNSCHILVYPGNSNPYAGLFNDQGNALTYLRIGDEQTAANSQCEIAGRLTRMQTTAEWAELEVAVRFSANYAGVHTVLLWVQDYAGEGLTEANAGEVQVAGSGTNQPPLDPEAASADPMGPTGLLAVRVQDPDGVGNILYADLLVGEKAEGRGGCWVRYHRRENKFWLRDDTDRVWLGGFAPGQYGAVSNSACTLTGQQSKVQAEAGGMLAAASLTLLQPLLGENAVRARAADVAGAETAWKRIGVWTYPNRPALTYAHPAGGTGPARQFSAGFQDPVSHKQIRMIRWVIGDPRDLARSCAVQYDFTQNEASLYGEGAWTAISNQIEDPQNQNSRCRVISVNYGWNDSNNTKYLHPWVAFKPGFEGLKKIYASASNSAGGESGWVEAGSFTAVAPNRAPALESFEPQQGSGLSGLFRFAVSDPDGTADLQNMVFHVGDRMGDTRFSCALSIMAGEWIYLLPDFTGGWTSGRYGEAKTIENSQCRVDLAKSRAEWTAERVTVTLSIEFKSAFQGVHTIWVDVRDWSTGSALWRRAGAWTVPAPPQ
jgi:hypothetical protein